MKPVPGPLPKDEFDRIFAKVPRLTVEVLIVAEQAGVLLALRDVEPCLGTWNLAGGTVRFGEPLVDAVRRVARDELGLSVWVGPLVGYIEYPSHYNNGLDSPVGLAFATDVVPGLPDPEELPDGCGWFSRLPVGLYEEQRAFLVRRLGFGPSGPAPADQ